VTPVAAKTQGVAVPNDLVAWLDAAHKDYGSFRRRLAVHLGRLDRLGVGYRKLSGR
jgi:hypothetical protein